MSEPLLITHSVMDARAVAAVLWQHWDLPSAPYAELLTRGMNDVYLVRAGGTQYAARAWRANRNSEDDVAYELGMLEHLDAAGLSVANPVASKGGVRFVPLEAPEGQRFLALFRWADGTPFGDNPDTRTARRIGVLFAKIHKAAADFAPSKRRYVDHPGALLRELPAVLKMAAHRPEDLDYYPRAAAAIADALAGLDKQIAPFGPGHGDFHLYNAFVSDDGAVRFLDFDLCGEDHYAQELMSFTWANDYVGVDKSINDAFLEGYNAERPLSTEESNLLPLFYAAKELGFLCGFATNVNYVGHSPFLDPDLDWFAQQVRRHVTEAGLL